MDPIRFSSQIRYWNTERSSGLAVSDIPPVHVQAFGGLKQQRVRGTIGGAVFTSNVMPPGFDGPWATAWRERLVDVRLRALDLLSQVWLAKGEPAQASRDAEAIVRIDPYREEAYRTLIRAHLARGDRASAARTYAQLTERLAGDLGVEPTMATRELLEGTRPPLRR